jgi:hypothetical protein
MGGSAPPPPASFSITPASSSVASPVDVNTIGSQTVTLTVKNVGGTASAVTVMNSDANNFAVSNGCGTASVAPGASCTLTVSFQPKSIGGKSTMVSVSPGASGMSAATITGTGRDQLALTVVVAGTGTGTVTAPAGVQGNGISCAGDCTESYYRTDANPMVTLTASFSSAANDVTWSAPCAGSTTTCTVTLSAAQTVTVTFTKKTYVVTVTRSAEAAGSTGTVTGSGITCGSTCTVTVNAGATVSLTAAPGSGYYFSAWNGGGCSGGGLTCTTSAINANTTIDAKFTKPNVIFTTSALYTVDQFASNGSGNPQTGADNYCKERAAAGSSPLLAGRTFTSLITLGTSPGSAAGANRVVGRRGWVRPDGKPFGDLPSTFFQNYQVYYPPALDENGNLVTDGHFNSAALGDGCVGWTSILISDYRAGGVPMGGGYGWNNAYGMPCVYPLRLYCMSTDYVATIPAPGYTGSPKIAFISTAAFKPPGSTGIAAADAICASEASAASLPGTFRALLATTTASAISRFAGGGPWVRRDGVSIGTFAQLSSGSSLDGSISMTASGVYVGNAAAWGGAPDPMTVGTAVQTCASASGVPWTSTDVDATGYAGEAYNTDSRFFYFPSTTKCNATYLNVYCLQM